VRPKDSVLSRSSIIRKLLPSFAGVICPSPRTAAEVTAYGVQNVEIAPPGVDRPERMPERRHRGALRLLCVATLTPRKGHLVLLDALARLLELDWRLTLVGSLERDPATTELVRRRIAHSGIEDRVVLAGERPPGSLGGVYAEADVFVLPSYHEGYGMAFVEAMAWGLPIVATRAGAIPETVPAEAGLLVPPGDVAALAEALREIIVDESLRAKLAQGAACHAATLPSWPEAIAGWAAAFDRLTR